MKITIGTRNEIKLNALKEIKQEYQFIKNAHVISIDVNTGISHQPKSLEETIQGAINRAKDSFDDCNLSFGLEDGLMQIPNFNKDYFNICACAIYDGKDIYIGLSSAYKYPREAVKLVFEKDIDINGAFYKLGLTNNPKVGNAEGSVGILTKGRLTRKDYVKQAIMMALASLESKDLK